MERQNGNPEFVSIDSLNKDKRKLNELGDTIEHLAGIKEIARHRGTNRNLYFASGDPAIPGHDPEIYSAWRKYKESRDGRKKVEFFAHDKSDDHTFLRIWMDTLSNEKALYWTLANISLNGEIMPFEFERGFGFPRDRIYLKKTLSDGTLSQLVGIFAQAFSDSDDVAKEIEPEEIVKNIKTTNAFRMGEFLTSPTSFLGKFKDLQIEPTRQMSAEEFGNFIQLLELIKENSPGGITVGDPGYGSHKHLVIEANESFANERYNPKGLTIRAYHLSGGHVNLYIDEIEVPVMTECFGEARGGLSLSIKNFEGPNNKWKRMVIFEDLFNTKKWIYKSLGTIG